MRFPIHDELSSVQTWEIELNGGNTIRVLCNYLERRPTQVEKMYTHISTSQLFMKETKVMYQAQLCLGFLYDYGRPAAGNLLKTHLHS